MKDYVISIRAHFGTAQALADFMGVSIHTVTSWTLGTRKPSDESMRLLEVLGALAVDAPHVLSALTARQATVKRHLATPPALLTPLVISVDFDNVAYEPIIEEPEMLFGSSREFWQNQISKIDPAIVASSEQLREVQAWLASSLVTGEQ